MLLDRNELKKRISNNQICIKKFKSFNNSTLNEDIIGIEELDGSQFREIRMGITIGPLIKTHNNYFFEMRKKFKDYKNIFDIRKSDNKIVIKPNETISILSNEHIELKDNTAAFILPRLTLTDIGLTLIPTYIDPNWSGILQMTIVNTTSNYQTLELGESIGQCFFLDVKNDSEERTSSQTISQTSHHYAQTWQKLFSSDTNPFPTKKSCLKNIGIIKRNSEKIKQGLLNIGIITILGLLIKGTIDINNFFEKFESIESNKKRIEKIESSHYKVGKSELKLKKGEKRAEKTFNITSLDLSGATVFVKFKNIQLNKTVNAYISDETINNVTLKIEVDSKYIAKKDEKLQIEWIMIK